MQAENWRRAWNSGVGSGAGPRGVSTASGLNGKGAWVLNAAMSATIHQPDAASRHGYFRRRRGVLALFGATLVLWISFRLYTGICLEDALITYRYAENIALGQGYVYNLGERVQGTTTPLLTLALAAGGRLFGTAHIPFIANVLMMLAGLLAGGFTAAALRKAEMPGWIPLLGAAFVLFSRDLLWAATGGMETPLVLCWMAMGLWALASRRPFLAAISSAGLVLTRIDGLVWSALLWLGLLAQLRLRVWKPALLFAVLVLPWFAWAAWYFGNPLPHSMLAKQAHAEAIALLDPENVRGFLNWYARPLGMGMPAVAGLPWLVFAARAFLVAVGIGFLWRRRPASAPLWILPAFFLLFGAAMFAGRAPRPFPWYLLPATWAALVLGAMGAAAVWSAAGLWRGPVGLRYAVRAAVIGVTLGIEIVLAAQTFAFHREFQANENGLRKTVGLWLRDHTPPGASVAMEAIGYQGVYSQRRIIDLDALTSPEVLAARLASRNNAESFATILEKLRPDYLVLRSCEPDRNQHFHGGPLFETDAQREAFWRSYQEVGRWHAPYPESWGERAHLTVFGRRAVPDTSPR